MAQQTSVYDKENFFALYQKLRSNPKSVNEIIEKPTMLSLLPDLSGKRVLDLGCGTGEHLQLYLSRGAAFVAGVDLSANMLAQAQADLEKCGEFHGRFALHASSMEALSALELGQFDVVTSSFAFHYVQDFPALLQAISAKLQPHGILVFSQEHPVTTCHKVGERWEKDVHKQQVAYRLNHYREEGERDRNWFKQPFKTYHRKTATIMNDLIQAGFHIERVEEPMLEAQPQWHEEFKDLQHRPVLLFVRARKNVAL